jgi:hypothetical protein
MVATVRFVLIVLAYARLPLYGLWILGGVIADRRRQKFVASSPSIGILSGAFTRLAASSLIGCVSV